MQAPHTHPHSIYAMGNIEGAKLFSIFKPVDACPRDHETCYTMASGHSFPSTYYIETMGFCLQNPKELGNPSHMDNDQDNNLLCQLSMPSV